ncbi:MAG: hypothetical protein ACK4S6_00320 [Roseateles asaccharophilus]|uniref:hypothetical protein n=1 Tax=Roseateles asaccharophilus TaxID=582607 RepID=UPI0039191DC0
MSWRILAFTVFFLVAASPTNARAQAELPSQWLNEQMCAAKLGLNPPRCTSGLAIDATAGNPPAIERAGDGARQTQPKEAPRPAASAASSGFATKE